jgi:hypothetical protein
MPAGNLFRKPRAGKNTENKGFFQRLGSQKRVVSALPTKSPRKKQVPRPRPQGLCTKIKEKDDFRFEQFYILHF